MPLSSTAAQALDEVNAMSDHRAQVDASLNLVSQNLQGPYAIKGPNSTGPLYSFDLPDYRDKSNPKRLHELTGMDLQDCKQFITANINRDATTLNALLAKYKIGDILGQGGHRRALETDAAYSSRMTKQVNLLKSMIDGGANALSIQEQPYLGIDNKRYLIFKNIMERAGYVSVAKIDQRDVGIWVKKEMKTQSHPVDLPGLSNSPLRGCAAEVDGILCINLHADRASNSTTVDALLALKKDATTYARSKTPPLRISITGDMNLFQLAPAQKKRLENNGFTAEMVKGQENIKLPNLPSYEAFFEDKGPPHISAKLSGAAAASTPVTSAHPMATLILREGKGSAIPNYSNISQQGKVTNIELKDMWQSVLTSNRGYDPSKDLLVHAKSLPPVLQSQLLTTYLRTCDEHPGIPANPKIKEVTDALKMLKAQISSAAAPSPAAAAHSTGVFSIGKNALKDYIKSRDTDNRIFFGHFDKYFGGHDKTTKVSAAKKLSGHDLSTTEKFKITKKEYDALKQGRLKDIASEKLDKIGKENIEITPDHDNVFKP